MPNPVVENDEIDFSQLEKSLRRPRTLFSAVLSGVTFTMTLIACVPLFSVLAMLMYHGFSRLSAACFTELPPTAFEDGGGFGNALVGTIVMVGMAALLSVPFGILSAIVLAIFGPDTKLATAVRFCAKTLTGFPSILAGVFAFAAVVMVTKSFSAVAGGVALAILMLPIVLLTAEEAIRMVPSRMKEAAYGMGCTQTQVVWKIVVPTAFPGILTGVMLSVARAAGETAPLLFTALFSNYWLVEEGTLDLMKPTASLAVLIFKFSYESPYENQNALAWAAALVLVLMVLTINVTAQFFSRRQIKA